MVTPHSQANNGKHMPPPTPYNHPRRRGTQTKCHAGAVFRLAPECLSRHNSTFPMSAARERPFSHRMFSRPAPASRLLLHYSGLIHLPLRFLCLALCTEPFSPLTMLFPFLLPFQSQRHRYVYLSTPLVYFLSSPSKAYSSLLHSLPPSTRPPSSFPSAVSFSTSSLSFP